MKPRDAAFFLSRVTLSNLRCSSRLVRTLVSPEMVSSSRSTRLAPICRLAVFSLLTVTVRSLVVDWLLVVVTVISPADSSSSATSCWSCGRTVSAFASSASRTVNSAVLVLRDVPGTRLPPIVTR